MFHSSDNAPLDVHQRVAVMALEELQEICNKYGIRFYLLAGSCLGAVRHEGMIPWDDDIDIGLLLSDWLRLRKILPLELSNGYKYVDETIQENWPYLFGKILFHDLLCIDLFVLVKWTGNTARGRIHWLITKIIYAGYMASVNNIIRCERRPEWNTLRFLRSRIMYYIKIICKPILGFIFDRNDFIYMARWNERFFEKKKTEWYINLYSVYSMKKEMIRAEWLNSPSKVKYEGRIYDTVGDTDAYLRHLYGDYMTLPPEEKRVQIHEGKAG